MYNTVIVLGAGYNQIQYLKELRKFKLKIICIDKDKKKEGFYYADRKIICSTHNHTKIINILEKDKFTKYKVVSVIAPSTGYPYKTAQILRKKFCLSFIDQKKVEILLDKKKLRLKLNKIKCSKISILNPNKILKKNFFPLVIKPRFKGTGGKGVKLIKTFKDFKSKKNFKNNNLYVFEKLISGRELAVDFIWDKKKIRFLNTGWHIYNKKNKKIVGATSQVIDKRIVVKLRKLLTKICKNFNFDREVINVDAIVDQKKKIHIIEFEFVPHEGIYLSKECFNYNLVKNYVNCYLNKKIDISSKRKKEAFVSILRKKDFIKNKVKFSNFFKYDKNIKNKKNFIFVGVSVKKYFGIENIIDKYYKNLNYVN